MLRRRLQMAGNGGGSLLPPELQACEWLKSDGNAAIILDYIANENTVIKMTSSNTGTKNNVAIFGSRVAYQSKQFCFVINNLNNYVVLINNEDSTQTNINKTNNIEIEFSATGFVKINDAQTNFTPYTQKNEFKLCVFSQNQNGSIMSGFDGNIIKYDIEENGNKVISLIDCYIKADQTYTDNKGTVCPAGTPGMFDLVNNVFYTNDGTGEFTHGADIIL